jgi:hypothetical protein
VQDWFKLGFWRGIAKWFFLGGEKMDCFPALAMRSGAVLAPVGACPS